jgi:hypothetical protein
MFLHRASIMFTLFQIGKTNNNYYFQTFFYKPFYVFYLAYFLTHVSQKWKFWPYILGWSEIEIFKNQKELKSKKLRTLTRNNFCSTIFQHFKCEWPRLGLKGRKKVQKSRNFSVFWRFFQKLKSKSWIFVLFWSVS